MQLAAKYTTNNQSGKDLGKSIEEHETRLVEQNKKYEMRCFEFVSAWLHLFRICAMMCVRTCVTSVAVRPIRVVYT